VAWKTGDANALLDQRDLDREGWLGDPAALGRPAEVPEIVDREDVFQLAHGWSVGHVS